MSTRYPGDTNDALRMEDGTPWYMSPDIQLTTAVANVGPNDIRLTARLEPQKTFPTSQAEIEVFVGNPSLVMSPTAGTVRIGTVLVARSDLTGAATGSVQRTLVWTVPAVDPADPDRPDQPGHRCLVARIYPFGSSKPADFQVVADQHEAQRNICVVDCAESGDIEGGAGAGAAGGPEHPIGKGEDGLWAFALDTTTLTAQPEVVGIRATVILQPTPFERDQLKPLLHPGFNRFSPTPPPTTALTFRTAETVVDPGPPTYSPICTFLRKVLPIPPLWKLVDTVWAPKRPPGARVRVELKPGRTARLAVQVDLSTTPVHEAHLLRVEQVGAGGEVQGGTVLVFQRVAS